MYLYTEFHSLAVPVAVWKECLANNRGNIFCPDWSRMA